MSKPSLKSKASFKDDKDHLYEWLNNFEFSKPKKNLARDFSDGVLLAELLKKHFPKFVEMHNYPPANSVMNKLNNWIRLNEKVLSRIGLPQHSSVLKDAANASRNVIEDLLIAVKDKLEEIELLKKLEENDDKSNVITEDTFCAARVVELHIQSTVPYEEHCIILQELETKKEEILALQAKVSHLESMLELKDQRISDLSFQLRRCTCHK